MNSKGKMQLIAKGCNSEIYVVNTPFGGAALKIKHLSNQCKVLESVQHDNIIKMLKYQEGISLQDTSRNVLVLEKAKHGNLLQFFQRYKPCCKQSRWLCSEVANAVNYLHCNYFVHRDLKLENVLVAQKESKIKIKLADFGFACSTKYNTSIMSNSFKGTKKGYMAPQIHEVKQQPTKKYDIIKADIFALGVMMFALVLGRFPFEYAKLQDPYYKYIIENDMEGFWNIHKKYLLKKEFQQGSMIEDFQNLFIKMVDPQPSRRISLYQIMQSQWFKGQSMQINVSKIKQK